MSTSRASRRVERKRKSETAKRDPSEYGKDGFSEDDPVLIGTVVRFLGDGRGEKEGAKAFGSQGPQNFGSPSLANYEARENGSSVNGLRTSDLGLVADGFLGLSPYAEESVGLRPKTFFASCSGLVVENPTLDAPSKEGSVSLKPMHAMAHPSNPPHRVFKALSKPRASIPCLLETEEL